jgi:type II secretory pathway pseudopilin PulG
LADAGRRSARRRGAVLDPAGEDGYTLIEAVIVVSLLLVVLFPLTVFILSTQRGEGTVSDATGQQQTARLGMETMSRWLRQGGYAQGQDYTSSAVFVTAGDNAVTFYSDPDANGIEDELTYSLSGTSIIQTTVVPDCSGDSCSYDPGSSTLTFTLIDNVRNADLTGCGQPPGSQPLFTFWKVDQGTGQQVVIPPSQDINQLVDISFVTITVVDDVSPGKAPTCVTLATQVQIRNWRP